MTPPSTAARPTSLRTQLPGLSVGIAAAATLLALLGLTRLLVPEVAVADLEVREVEIAAPSEPPPPPPAEPPPDVPPPPPALTELGAVADPTRVPVPEATVPLDFTLPVDPFFPDAEPAPLPQKPVARSAPPENRTARSSAPPTAPPPPPPPAAKSQYDVGELDGKPRLLRHGKTSFPTSLARKGVASGTVLLEVELSTGGRVSVRSVLRASHPELVSAARRVAASARFTPPTRNGQPVKALMRWPITIKQ